MPKDSTPENASHAERNFGDMERDVVYMLTDPGRQPTLWAVPDIGRELDYFDPDGVLEPLLRAGLVYKTCDGFVFASPAAFHLTALVGHVV